MKWTYDKKRKIYMAEGTEGRRYQIFRHEGMDHPWKKDEAHIAVGYAGSRGDLAWDSLRCGSLSEAKRACEEWDAQPVSELGKRETPYDKWRRESIKKKVKR
jgi:hypothetical protein